MCGLVGVFGDVSLRAFDAFEVMLALDSQRGKDSTGVAAVTREKKIHIVKDAVFPLELMRTEAYAEYIEAKVPQAQLLMGHNRAATKGVVNKKNAHPFRYGHITGCHNGTLTDDLEIDKRKFDVDSKEIFYAISKVGIKEVWKKLRGAAALTWYDAKEDTFNIINNGRRPFFFGYTQDKKQLFYSSEKWMYREAAARAGFRFAKDEDWKTKDDVLLVFRYDREKNRIIHLEATQLEKWRWVQTSKPGNNQSTFSNGTWKAGQANNSQAHHGQTHIPSVGKASNVVTTYPGKALTKLQFYKKYGDKCVFCQGELQFEDYVPLTEDIAACSECSDLHAISQLRKWSTWCDGYAQH